MKKTKIKKPKNGFKGQKSKDIEWNDSHTSQQNSGKIRRKKTKGNRKIIDMRRNKEVGQKEK